MKSLIERKKEYYDKHCGYVNEVELWRFKELINNTEGLKSIKKILGKTQFLEFLKIK